MKKLVVVRAPGLSPEESVRGDQAWNLSDLIAEGSFAPLSGAPDIPGSLAALPREQVTVVEVPFKDSTTFDAALGKIREGAGGAALVVVSDTVFISQHCFRELKPGVRLAPAELPRLLGEMLR